MTEDINLILNSHNITPTPNRILVLKELARETQPVNLAELEVRLCPMDKVSIFRVLELFVEKEIVHVLHDGTRSLKYELCRNKSQHHNISDQHVHFYCTNCKRIFCFEDVSIPVVNIPPGFNPRVGDYMLKGLCPNCKD